MALATGPAQMIGSARVGAQAPASASKAFFAVPMPKAPASKSIKKQPKRPYKQLDAEAKAIKLKRDQVTKARRAH